eukprot:30896-Prorocentrum_minimum.AAC.2
MGACRLQTRPPPSPCTRRGRCWQPVDGQDRGGCGRFDGSWCVDRPVVGLLGGGGVRNGVVGHVVGVRIGVVKLGSASSLSSYYDGHSLADCVRKVVVGTCYGTM